MNKINLIFLFSLLTLTIANGQSKEDKQLVKNLDGLISEKFNSVSPGCAVLVAKKGQVIYEKGFGTANIELNVPMRPEMVFRIGSMTKQYTAIAVLQLVEQGKISLQDSIQKFIKNFPSKGHAITIENLLTHTSGIKDYGQLDSRIPNAIRVEFPQKVIIDSLARLPLDFNPSAKYSYSNSNYYMLGYIIEQVTSKSYKDYLQENIFKPAGLSNTFYDSPTQLIPNRANGYSKNGSNFKNTDYISMSLVYGAGALLSNVGDLYKWHQALNSYKLVKKETLEKAFTSFKLDNGQLAEYGYGWFIKDWKGSRTIGHGGAIDGFRSWEIYFPEQDIFLTALFNSDNNSFFNLFDDMGSLIVGKSLQTAYKDLKIDAAVLNNYVGTYTFSDFPSESIKIYKRDNKLLASISNGSGSNMALLAQSETLFYLPDIRRIPTTIEFIVEKGKVKGMYWTQEKRHECTKTE
ncbi:CubicO group peptidase, beta-lactamase class C family [Flavobacterium fluvii]|uniref:CubicO group peptidase, beta-lactamase class C family n=1 Tax=Flavobacterium fluvii TaxID=468056 RepID=A0A1M5FKZ9_9FLAO|nr:serine hydrolase domain-containing protein [Flavobacterium fluvii]SHF92165.1 CubicO group peptidase, beta-lactamase class C family [Flavobacterium fluvii]